MKLAFLLLFSVFAFTACVPRRTGRIYELPEGFSGWALIEFEVNGAPLLSKKAGKYILTLGKDGRLVTSSHEESGYTNDEFYFVGERRTAIPVTGPNGGGLIWAQAMGGLTVPGKKDRPFEIFFVGSEQRAEASKQAPIPE